MSKKTDIKITEVDPYHNQEIKIVYEFANKIAKVMDDLRSSYVFFIIEQAYEDIEWEEVQKMLDNIIKITDGCCKEG